MTFDGPALSGENDLAALLLEILRKEGAQNEPVRLSVVGQRLAARLARPLRDVLAGEKLRAVVERLLRGAAIFEGHGPKLAVRIGQSGEATKRPIRFDPRLWAGFSKAIPPEKRRYIGLSGPFNFFDTIESVSDTYKIEISRDMVPDQAIPKQERDAQIVSNIEQWCRSNGLDPLDFVPYQAPVRLTEPIAHPEVPTHGSDKPAAGVDALLKLIEVVPEDQRAKYSLPIDLIYRLLAPK
jgi:hypothetical protein